MLQGQASSGFFRSSTGIQGKFSGKEKSKGITAQKSITRFLGCYKPSPLKGISSSRFVGVAQNYTHFFSKKIWVGENDARVHHDQDADNAGSPPLLGVTIFGKARNSLFQKC